MFEAQLPLSLRVSSLDSNGTRVARDLQTPVDTSQVTGARCQQQEARHTQNSLMRLTRRPDLHMVRDCGPGKELPDDIELDIFLDSGIPGLSVGMEQSFNFVEKEVRAQLGHVSVSKQDDVIRILRGYETTVFETRDIPRLAPFRDLNLTIDEVEGSRSVAAQPYSVAPQHLPEFFRQVAVLEKAEIFQRSTSQFASPVLFASKKDGTLRLFIDYC